MDRRFVQEDVKLKGMGTGAQVLIDEDTGVQYLFMWSGYAGGLTVMVDAEGKPLLHPTYKRERF